jgi:membrane-bound serine protease (ClpP class)
MGLYSLGTLPVNWTGVALIAVAFALFFIDIFVTSFGILLVGGMAAFIVGSYLLIDSSVPGYSGVSRPVIWTSAALIAASAVFIGSAVLRVMRKKPTTGMSSLIGAIGDVRQPLDPDGMVFVHGEHWTGTLVGGEPGGPTVPVGELVRVTDVQGLRLFVEPVEATAGATSGRVLPVAGGVRYVQPDPPGSGKLS